MKKTKQQPASKVVPFAGEFYPEQPEPMPAASNSAAYLVMAAAVLIAGLSIGSISTYQSADQVQLRQMKAQSQQLEHLKNQVCR